MLFAILCEDKPNSLDLRKETRPDHLAFLEGLGATLKFAGPFLSEADETPCGSLVVVEAGSRSEAEALAARDPYAKAGLFETVTVRPWVWSVNNPEAR